MLRPQRADDSIGGASVTFVDEGAAWAWIVARSGSETFGADRSGAVGAYAIELRAQAPAAPGWRLIWGARAFRILAMLDDGAATKRFDCAEETP